MENITLPRVQTVPARSYAPEKTADEPAQAQAAAPAVPEDAPQQTPIGADALAAAQLARAQMISAAQEQAGSVSSGGSDAADGAQTLQSLMAQKDTEVKNLMDMLEEMRKKAQEVRDKLKLPKNSSRYGYAAIEAYARLSRARSKAQVSSAAGYARRQLGQLQTALRQDPENAGRIRAAIRQLQGAVTRAARKKNELEDERIAEIRRKRAEKERRPGKARRIEHEIRRKQTVRKVVDSGYVSGACIAMAEQEHIEQQRAAQREQLEKIAGLGGQAADAVQAYTAQAADAPAADAAPTVQLEV